MGFIREWMRRRYPIFAVTPERMREETTSLWKEEYWGGNTKLENERPLKIKAWKHNTQNSNDLDRDALRMVADDPFKWEGVESVDLLLTIYLKDKRTVQAMRKGYTQKQVYKLIKQWQDYQDFDEIEGEDGQGWNPYSDLSPTMLAWRDLFDWYFFNNSPNFAQIMWGDSYFPKTNLLIRDQITGFSLDVTKVEKVKT